MPFYKKYDIVIKIKNLNYKKIKVNNTKKIDHTEIFGTEKLSSDYQVTQLKKEEKERRWEGILRKMYPENTREEAEELMQQFLTEYHNRVTQGLTRLSKKDLATKEGQLQKLTEMCQVFLIPYETETADQVELQQLAGANDSFESSKQNQGRK